MGIKHSSCLLLEFDGQDKPTGLVGAYKDLLTKMWSGAHQSLRAEQLAVRCNTYTGTGNIHCYSFDV